MGKLLAFVLCCFGLWCLGCSFAGEKEQQPVELQVAAAASLTDVLQEIAAAYTAEHPQVKIVFYFGSSGALAQALGNGGQADMFFSASAAHMDRLEKEGLLQAGSRRDLLTNELVLIVPNDDRREWHDFRQLAAEDIRHVAMGDPGSVPVGQYAEESLRSLGLWTAVQPKAVYATDVRQVLAWVESGNVDAGIVYATDAIHSGKVRVAAASEGAHQPIIYPVALLQASRQVAAAQDFIAYVVECRDVFRRYGFGVR